MYRNVPTCPFRDYFTYDGYGIYDAKRFINLTFWCEGNTTKGEIAGSWHGGPIIQYGSPILMERPIGIIRLANGASSTVDLDDYIQSDVTGTITYQVVANSQDEGSGAGASAHAVRGTSADDGDSEALVSASITGSELTLTAASAGQGAVELYFIATDAADNSIKGLVELTVEGTDATPAPTPEPTPEPPSLSAPFADAHLQHEATLALDMTDHFSGDDLTGPLNEIARNKVTGTWSGTVLTLAASAATPQDLTLTVTTVGGPQHHGQRRVHAVADCRADTYPRTDAYTSTHVYTRTHTDVNTHAGTDTRAHTDVNAHTGTDTHARTH